MNILVSYNWLKHYVAIKDAPEILARKLSLCGPSVERINHIQPRFKGVITARILDIQKHPNADKLQLVKVAVKEKNCKPKDILDIVCGAFNIQVGDKVPLATVGAVLPGDFKITAREVRGMVSNGMLCSDKELGISDNHSGILILPPEVPIGVPLEKVFGLEDYVFDTEITTNRPDALGMVGFARETAAIIDAKFLWKENTKLPKPSNKDNFPLAVKVEDKRSCRRYMAVAIKDIKVKDSPFWLKKRLLTAGLRPINNVVDITNYILLEYGQPLHAFDADKLAGEKGKKIIVRKALNGEEIETLDGVKRKLNTEVLVIADEQKALAVAGVMGGANSAVDENTKNIIIESANFDPLSVRKSSRSLNLFSDSSNRFEKGPSAEFARLGIARAVELMGDLAEGRQISKVIDMNYVKYKPLRVKLELPYLEKKLGVEIPYAKIKKILESLGFKIVSKKAKAIAVSVPYWRQGDIEISDDLVEEVARIYGYHILPSTLPKGDVPQYIDHSHFDKEERVKDYLSDLGFTEVYSNSMLSKKMLIDFGINPVNALQIKNPLNEDLVYMRTTLTPSVLKVVSSNLRHRKEMSIFELANVYLPQEGQDLPLEEMTLIIAVVSPSKEIFTKLKGVLEAQFTKLGVSQNDLDFEAIVENNFNPARTAAIKIKGERIGLIGEIHPSTMKKFDINQRIAVTEISWAKLIELVSDKKIYAPISKYPASELDLTVILGEKMIWKNIKNEILKTDSLIKEVRYVGVYSDEHIPKDKKSLTFHIVFQSEERTLKDEEIKSITEKILEVLGDKFGAMLRTAMNQ